MKKVYLICLLGLFTHKIISSDSMFQNMLNQSGSSPTTSSASSGDDGTGLFNQLMGGGSSDGSSSTDSSSSDDSGGQSLQNFLNQGQTLQNQVDKEEKYQQQMQEKYEQFYLAGGSSILSNLQTSGMMDQYNSVIKNIGSSLASSSTEAKVVAAYTKAFTDAITAYQDADLPIQINISNIAYSLFASICNIYKTHLEFMVSDFSASLTTSDFLSQFSNIITSFNDYQQKIETLADSFPLTTEVYDEKTGKSEDETVDLKSQAMKFYNYHVAQFILPVVHQVIVFVSGKTDPSSYVSGVETMYNFVTSNKGLHVAVTGYNSYEDFIVSLASNLAGMYEKAATQVEKEIDFVTKSATDNKAYLQTVYDEYNKAAILYKTLSGTTAQQDYLLYSHKATVTKEKLDAISDALTLQDDADTMVASLQKTLSSSSATLSDLQSAAADVGKVLTDYANAQAKYQVVGDVAAESIVMQKKEVAEGIAYVVGIKLLWAEYLANSSFGGAFLTNYFANLNPADTHYQVTSASFDTAIQGLQQMCTTANNPLMAGQTDSAKKTYLLMYVGAAVKLYGNAKFKAQAKSKKSSQTSRLASLQNVNTFVTNLAQFAQEVVKLDGAALGKSVSEVAAIQDQLNTVMQLAATLDSSYKNDKNLATYISNLAQAVLPGKVKTFQNFIVQHLYYLLMNIAQDLVTSNQAILAMSYYNILKGLALSKAQAKVVETSITTLADKADVEKHADTELQAAQDSSKWVSSTTVSSNPTWLNAIALYATAYSTAQGQVSSTKLSSMLAKYVSALEGYITAYKKSVVASKQYPFDLFGVYVSLYFVYKKESSSELSSVVQDITDMFTNSGKTGFFDDVTTNLATLQNSSASKTDQQNAQTAIQKSIVTFNALVKDQMEYVTSAVSMFHASVSPVLVVSKATKSLTWKLVLSGQKATSVTITGLDQFMIGKYMTDGNNYFDTAKGNEKDHDYATASTNYAKAQAQYKLIIEKSSNSTLVNTAKQKYFLAEVRAQACLLAGMLRRANVVTVGSIPDIALQYIITQYNIQIPLSLVDTLPSSLTSLPNNQVVAMNSSTQADVENLLKMFVVDAVVKHNGLSYTQCYEPYTLTRLSSLSAVYTNVCDKAEKAADDFVSKLTADMTTGIKVGKDTVTTTVELKVIQPKTVIITLKNAEIPPITPYYPGGIYATQYYGAALMLFKPGTKIIHAGSISYVPGQDPKAAQVMREYMAGTSVAEAQNNVNDAHAIALKIQGDIAAVEKAGKKVDLSTYQTQYNDMKTKYQTALSLLMAPNGSAQAYYKANKMNTYAQDVQDYVMTMYEQYAQDITVMLVGDPTSQLYVSILHDLNVTYDTQKQLTTDATIKQQLDVKIAEVFKNAGDACMAYNYKTLTAHDASETLDLYHFFNAGPNYLAAKEKYTDLKMTSDADTMNTNSVYANAMAAAQNMQQYVFVKKYGASYKDTLSSSYVYVTFDQLMANYAKFQGQYSLSHSSALPTAELNLYNQTRSLLLDGIMFFTSASDSYEKLPGATTSQADATKAVDDFFKAQGIEMIEQKVENPAAKKNKKAPATITKTVPQMRSDENTTKMQGLAMLGMKTFKSNSVNAAKFLSVMHEAGSYLYIYDYLGGVQESSNKETVSKEWSQKFQLLEQAQQAEGTRLQNPSSAYVG